MRDRNKVVTHKFTIFAFIVEGRACWLKRSFGREGDSGHMKMLAVSSNGRCSASLQRNKYDCLIAFSRYGE